MASDITMLSGSSPAADAAERATSMPLRTFAEVLAWLRKPMTLLALAVGAVLTFLFLWVTGILAGTVVVNLTWLQRSWLLWLTILLSTGLALTLLMLPIHIFRKYAQHQRIEQIESFYSADIITEYFTRFWAGSDGIGAAVKAYKDAPEVSPAEEVAADVLTAKFKAVLNDMFGLDRFRGATRLLFAVAACVLFAAFETGIMWGVDFGTSKEFGTLSVRDQAVTSCHCSHLRRLHLGRVRCYQPPTPRGPLQQRHPLVYAAFCSGDPARHSH